MVDKSEKDKIKQLVREQISSDDGKLKWMYNSKADSEEYLLGKRVDKTFERENELQKETAARSVGALFDDDVLAHNVKVDMQVKMREDPLFAIRKREEDARRALLMNPVKMKQLQQSALTRDPLSRQDVKHKKSKKHRHKSSSSGRSSDELLNTYLSLLGKKPRCSPERSHRAGHSAADDRAVYGLIRFSGQTQGGATGDDRASQSSHAVRSPRPAPGADTWSSSSHHRRGQTGQNAEEDLLRASHESDKRRKKKKKKRARSSSSSSSDSGGEELLRKYLALTKRPQPTEDGENAVQPQSAKNTAAAGTSLSQRQYNDGPPPPQRSSHSKRERKERRPRSPDQSLDSDDSRREPSVRYESASTGGATVADSRHSWHRADSHRPQSSLHSRADQSAKRTDSRSQDSEYLKAHHSQQRKGAPSKLTEEEKEARRQEMVNNARWQEEERKKNLRQYVEEGQKEEESRAKGPKSASGFLNPLMANHVEHSSVEDRLKRNRHHIQRTNVALDKNFAHR